MTYKGVYRDGIVILQGDIDLENGAAVEVNPTKAKKLAPGAKGKAGPKPAKSPMAKPNPRSIPKAKQKNGKTHPLPGFGAWKHRTDITDTAAFARELRRRVGTRSAPH